MNSTTSMLGMGAFLAIQSPLSPKWTVSFSAPSDPSELKRSEWLWTPRHIPKSRWPKLWPRSWRRSCPAAGDGRRSCVLALATRLTFHRDQVEKNGSPVNLL